MSELIYRRRMPLLLRDCDMYKRLRPSAVLTMFQDCSEALTEGWGVGLDAMMARGAIWVAAKVECTVQRLPLHGEEITVRGWAARCRSGIFPFRYELIGPQGETLVTGCSMWVLSDLEAHSMMGPNVPKITLPTPEPEGTPLPKLRPIRPPAARESTARRVRFSEVDSNGHLTNTRYLDWICDLAPADYHRTHTLRGLRVNYRAEIFPEEEVPLEYAITDECLWCAAPGRFDAMLLF